MSSYPSVRKLCNKVSGNWSKTNLALVDQVVADFYLAFGLDSSINLSWLHKFELSCESLPFGGLTSKGLIRLNPEGLTKWVVIHELAHAWDFSTHFMLSTRLMLATHSWGPLPILHDLWPLDKRFWYHAGSPPPPCGIDPFFNRLEDFAESAAAFVYPQEALKRAAARGYSYDRWGYDYFHQTPRGKFIARLAGKLNKSDAH